MFKVLFTNNMIENDWEIMLQKWFLGKNLRQPI